MTDHETTEKVFAAAEKAFAQPGGPAAALVGRIRDYCAGYVDSCHNRKEEEHLFPTIERCGIPRHGGPLAVMLGEHEQSRTLLAQWQPLADAFARGQSRDPAPLAKLFGEYATLLKNHFWKENDILYPMARRVMSPDDDEGVVRGIEAVEAAVGPDTRARYYALAAEIVAAGEVKDLVHNLDYDTLAAVLNTLPVELSFVDADDTVRYFSHENHPKIFGRTRGAIGMKVQQCHPKKSVHLVDRILAEFKAGTRDVAEFWIDMGPRKIHIRYWPVKSPAGKYLGCLETVQDVTGIRALEGQRRLLDDMPASKP
jgi:hypothetical protein